MIKLICFDLDGTLAESKSPIDREIGELLIKLLKKYEVAIISGGDYPQFQKQLIAQLGDTTELNKLHLYPTCGTKAYGYINGKFENIYSENLDEIEVKNAILCIEKTIEKFGLIPEKTYGELIENRQTQITYSALGQDAPYEIKKSWDPDFSKRKKIVEMISPMLSTLSVSMGGSTSIDITKSGIDKAYAIRKLTSKLLIDECEIIFIGDALMEGGNDYAVKKTNAKCIETTGPKQTKEIIHNLLTL